MQASDPICDLLVSKLQDVAPAFVGGQDSAKTLASAARWFSVPGGRTLFQRGSPSDSIYIVISGLFAVVIESPRGEQLISKLGAGEIIGEIGCITDRPRSATVRTLRSSEVIEIDWADIKRIAISQPAVLLSLCRIVVERSAHAQQGRLSTCPRTFALVPVGNCSQMRPFAESFKTALSGMGKAYLATRDQCEDMTAVELNQIETAHDFLIYLAEPENPTWTKRCYRQSDTVVAFANGAQHPEPLPDAHGTIRSGIPVSLVLDWGGESQPTRTADWVQVTGASQHFHVCRPAHVARIARLLTGNGLGLVLSGGGARGIAHIGVLKSLREQGIDIDIIMGTSIGAVIGAGIAMEWTTESMIDRIQQFLRFSPIWEINFPRLSLLAGRNIAKSFNIWFDDLQIEDMPTPYSCVSTNLNTVDVSVHQSGNLCTWIRASSAIPGVFPPVIVDGMVHVDGGVLNNLPTDLIRKQGAGYVVGVEVGGGDIWRLNSHSQQPAPESDWARLNILELLTRVGSIGDEAQAKTRRKQCDILLAPEMGNIGLLSFKQFDQAIAAGYEATAGQIADLLARGTRREDSEIDAELQL